MSAATAEALDLFDPDVVEDEASATRQPLRLVTSRGNPGVLPIDDQVIFNWPLLYIVWQ